MQGGRSFQSNIVSLVAGGTVTHLANLAFSIFSARWLGVADFGLLSYAATLVAILSAACDLGITVYTIRAVAQNPDRGSSFANRLVLVRSAGMAVGTGILALLLLSQRAPE